MPRNPWYDPSKAHHTERGFRNPPGSPTRPPFSSEVAREAAHFMGELMKLAGTHPFPDDHALSPAAALAGFVRDPTQDQLLWMGHASFLMRLGGTTFLTDPYLTDYASPVPSPSTKRLIPAAMPIGDLPVVDVILVSHNHYDHLDTKALKQLAKRFPGALVVVPLGLKKLLSRQGFSRIVELDWFDDYRVDGFTVTGVPAVHMSRRGVLDLNATLWCGFAVQCHGKQVYFAGDTAYGPVFQEVGAHFGGFDVGLVPIGAYQPRSLMAPVHCTPEEAVRIGEELGSRQLIGMHWGTIRLTTEPMMEPAERFMQAPGQVPRRVLRIGETLSLGG